jgi:hypothetical protein
MVCRLNVQCYACLLAFSLAYCKDNDAFFVCFCEAHRTILKQKTPIAPEGCYL